MADIKCPKCGKINPSFADYCLACQAPLSPSASPSPSQDNPEEQTPEWLKRIRERTQTEPDAKSALEGSAEPVSEEDFPDWLKQLKEEKIGKEIPEIPEAEGNDNEDWLERLRTSPVYRQDSSPEESQTESENESEEKSAQTSPAGKTVDKSGWTKSNPPATQKPLGDFMFPAPDETHPDDATIPVSISGDGQNPFGVEHKPPPPKTEDNENTLLVSLTGESEQEGRETQPFRPEPNEKNLSGGQEYIPGFFQAAALSNRVNLTEKQRLNVSLLKEIISNESEPVPVPQPAAAKKSHLGRLATLLTILLILLAILAVAPYPLALPQLYPVEVASLFNQVSTLPENSPVLLAVDYDPSLAGEMQLASAGLIGHLMARSARLTLISTRPAGPMLANALIQAVLPGQPRYPSGENIVNLGYLPGDAAGLRAFARQPKAFTPYTNDLKLGWDSQALQGVNYLGDFSAVVVITDSAEVMRNWVEQVQPALGAVPLYVVLSAQAGPLIQPYFDSEQIQGGLSGLSGGVMYSQILGRSGFANPYMNAFQVGSLLAVLAILGGGLVRLLASIIRGMNEAREEKIE